MRRFLMLTAIFALAFGAAVAPAHAALITYTTGSFSLTFDPPGPGFATVHFTGYSDTVNAPLFPLYTIGTLGWFTTTANSTGAGIEGDFYLTVNSTSGLAGYLLGSVTSSHSTGEAIFPEGTKTAIIDGFLFEIVESVYVPAPNGSPTYVQAKISATAPEPSTLLLVGTGLTGLAGVVRRRISRRR